MRPILILPLLALGVLSQPVMAADNPSTTQNSDDANIRVRALFRQAYTAYNAHNYEESRQLLMQAWAIRQTYDVASALAQSEMKLQQYRDAATHLQYCLDNFAPSVSEQTFEAIKQALADAKSHIGTLHITANHDGISVLIDGQLIGDTPLTSPVYVEPGQHEVEFKQGSDSAKLGIMLMAAGDLNVDVPLVHKEPLPEPQPVVVVPTPPPVPATAPNTSTSTRDKLNQAVIPGAIAGATFAIGVGMAIGFRLAANSKDDQADQLRTKVGPSGCAPGATPNPDCAVLMDTAKSKDSDRNWSTAGIVLAGMALVSVPIYWYWPRAGTSASLTSTNLRVKGNVGTNYSGIALSGNF
jgi:hypothetical protein